MEAHEKKVMAARTALILDEPFFGRLAMKLRLKPDLSCKTAWVDGRTFGYNPSFVESLSHAQLVGLVAHEVMHCATGHPWRRDNRNHKRWNVACDHAINPILVSTGFTLPDDALLDSANEGKSAEWIYARLPQSEEGEEGGEEGEQGSDSSNDSSDEEFDSEQGEVRDAPDDAADDGSTEGDWTVAVQQAANAAAAQGKLSDELRQFAADVAEPAVDWRSALRRFIQETTAADYTWKQPSPRYVARGLYLPKLQSEEMGPMVIAIDTSGSVDAVMLARFNVEVRAIVEEANPSRVHVIYCDAIVQRIDTFEREELIDFEKLEPAGGGGTKFWPVFKAVEELDEVPACIVYLTDLYGYGDPFPAVEPEVPTLWATVGSTEAPFGEVIPIND